MNYVSHATSFDFRRHLYPAFPQDASVILPYLLDDAPFNILRYLNGKLIKKVIAEISYPSTGQGIELGWSAMKGVPIFGGTFYLSRHLSLRRSRGVEIHRG